MYICKTYKVMEKQKINSNPYVLKGFTSMLIGGYIFIGSYVLKTILDKFLLENKTLETLSNRGIELIIISVILLIFIISTFTIYNRGKKNSEKLKYNSLNVASKNAIKKYLIGFLIMTITLLFLFKFDFNNYITPIFLIFYGFLLYFLKNNKRKDFLMLAGLSVLLGALCFLIPSYWYSSLTILGIAHITYGVVVKE